MSIGRTHNINFLENSTQILYSIKSRVHEVAPDAKVLLFGSRAYGQPTSESDWDILILTHQPVNNILKDNIHYQLFPISVRIGAFINALTVQEEDWVSNPAYYSIRQSIKSGLKQHG
ncbi:MAG: nucleotidyltransferase domain-containing protein [Candidatus Pseudobacter hemicellulosilyticus]|uniref:Nucleotidyltransferase domain-containing protein n=1 Tax=Candidatus Pseudobacter hemicellulosilyticus TaxID=3121375 RepID=A0AAJ6BIC2_9BACT|nr:MAG: nucleotidyltransferase domain-containing protein [Pseudobacter sp.]